MWFGFSLEPLGYNSIALNLKHKNEKYLYIYIY